MINYNNVHIKNKLDELAINKHILLEQRDTFIKAIFTNNTALKQVNRKCYDRCSNAIKEQYPITTKYEDNFGYNRGKYLLGNAIEVVNTTLGRYNNEIRDLRREIKDINSESGNGSLNDIWNKSKEAAKMFLARESNNYCGYYNRIVKQSRDSDQSIPINILWNRSVFDKGLAMISTSKGKQFVTHANEVVIENIPNIEDYNLPDCTVFKVTAIRLNKNTDHQTTNGWLLIHNYDKNDITMDNYPQERYRSRVEKHEKIKDIYTGGKVTDAHKIHAFHSDLKSAGRLLARRVKSEIINNLME